MQAFPPEPSGLFAHRLSALLDRVWAYQLGETCVLSILLASKTRTCLFIRDLIQLHYCKWHNDVKLPWEFYLRSMGEIRLVNHLVACQLNAGEIDS